MAAVTVSQPISAFAQVAGRRGTDVTKDLVKEWWVPGQNGKKFCNPWPSFREPGAMETLRTMRYLTKNTIPPPPNPELGKILPVHEPTFGLEKTTPEGLKVTWLGHACVFIEFPAEDGSERGVRMIFDPVFSKRCSPTQLVGPARFTDVPCKIEDLPEFDILALSHNHYDHLDIPTLKSISRLSRQPKVIIPLNTSHIISGIFPDTSVTEVDWWDSVKVSVDGVGEVEFNATPAQHMTARGIFDRFTSLWLSYVIKSPSTTLFFSGDTAYSALPADASPTDHEYYPDLPFCPAFKEIGLQHPNIDVAIIGIGAYEPRGFMSSVHCSPLDAVRIYKDLGAKQALGMHYGSWQLTTEAVDDPIHRLKAARELMHLKEDQFTTMDMGATKVYPVEKEA